MAFIRKLASGKFQVRWYSTQGKETTRTCATHGTAQKIRRDVEDAIALGIDWEPQGPRALYALSDAGDRYLKHCATVRELAPRTVLRYAESLDLLSRYLEEQDGKRRWTVGDLSKELAEGWWVWLRTPATGRHGQQRAVSSARKHVEVLIGARHGLWAWCRGQTDLREDTPEQLPVDLPSRPRPSARPLPTWAEWDAMLGALTGTAKVEGAHAVGRRVRAAHEAEARTWLWQLAVLARYTGGRREELLLARWEHVDLERASLFLPAQTTKGGYGERVIPLHSSLVEELAGWGRREARVIAAPPEALDVEDDKAHIGRTLGRAWKRAGVHDSVWKRRPLHVARHLLRTHLVRVGTQPDVIDALLGHAGEGTGGRTYTHRPELWPELVEAVASIPTVGQARAPRKLADGRRGKRR